MMYPNDVLWVGSIIFPASGLLVYWGSRVLALLCSSEEELNEMLDRDLDTSRQIWFLLRGLFSPSQSFCFGN